MRLPPIWLRVLAVAAAAIVALIGLVIHEELALAAGTEVRLAMTPVDPQALLSGHYVSISLSEPLAFGRPCPPGAKVTSPTDIAARQRRRAGWWVALSPLGDHDVISGVAPTRAAAARMGAITVAGDAVCTPPTADVTGGVVTDLGVDRVSFSQDEAARISEQVGAGQVLALISIAPDGKARTKGLIVGGKRAVPAWY